nr:MMPL family transporter [Agromyces seonyuensis]
MSSVLYALGAWAYRARRLVLLVWLAVLALAVATAALVGTGTVNTYSIPGTESQDALDALARTFPEVAGSSAQLVAAAPDGDDVDDPDFQRAVEAGVAGIADLPQVVAATSPYDTTSGVSADRSAVLVGIPLTVPAAQVTDATAEALQQAGRDLQAALPPGSEVAVGGQLFSQDPAGIGITELLGILVAYLVLLATFRAFLTAALPLATALFGVGVALSIVVTGTAFLTVTSTTPLLSLMLGLAVGIDYALFIVSRHRDQLPRGSIRPNRRPVPSRPRARRWSSPR